MKKIINFSTWKFGIGYTVINTRSLRLIPQISGIRTSFKAVRGIHKDGEGKIEYRNVGPRIDLSYLIGLKLWNRLGDHVALVSQGGYQPYIGGSEMFMASRGVSFTF
ncbi:hypothetical protein [Echinicola vietnamensis]|uniref:Uncharacterized protein n=1 Tax=Echinicola vietnamensis (strain DSM 17526 / LMG 23754 / KMM 6221) TaxID=926556 RepID=L0FU77_ECHVK|nr:hypothetical protein [Echinicola vietnamensis]AGA77454.1 hypothetical protein Echvi_1183 [Echinicola vietnamensis DSM 17526]